MAEFSERSAYPTPNDFEVMRPEYTDLEDGTFQAEIIIAPFKVTGISSTKPGARRAAIYEAEKTYRSYHPSYRVKTPYPDSFTDQENVKWQRVPPHQRETLGDYRFVGQDDEEDFADIENMLMWDVRPATEAEAAE